jgi:hypothetical protein
LFKALLEVFCFSEDQMSTISVPSILNVDEDCQDLNQAFRGLGCDAKKVIAILGHRTLAQRRAIADAYFQTFGEDLHKRLKSELHGNFEKAMLLWMMDAVERDAQLLLESMKGIGRNDTPLLGILCSRTPSQLQLISQTYFKTYHKSLESQIEGDTSGDYRKLLLALVSGNRSSESLGENQELALADAHELYRAGAARLGTNEDTFIHVFTTRNAAQLRTTLQLYEQTFGHALETVIKKEISGNFQSALLTVMQCTCCPARFFAKELYHSMKGLGTDDNTLIRVVTTRAEVDMQYIKAEFSSLYNKSLERMITGDTSGNYRLFLLTLVGGV